MDAADSNVVFSDSSSSTESDGGIRKVINFTQLNLCYNKFLIIVAIFHYEFRRY